MSQLVDNKSLRIGLLTYILLLLVPVLLKLLGVASASWWLITVFGWGPVVFTVVFVVLGFLWPLLKGKGPVL